MSDNKDLVAEMRHLISFVQSHIDKQDVHMEDVEYTVDTHVVEEERDDSDVPQLRTTGATVRATFEYSFKYD